MAGAIQFRRVLWFACACALLLASRAEAFSPTLTADFDGDGQTDWVLIDRAEPSVLHVWLSGSGTATHIRSRRPVLQVVARDLDGDHLPELITTEEAGNVREAWKHARTLRVWKKDASHGFRRFRFKRTPAALHAPPGPSCDEAAPADDVSEGLGGSVHPRESATSRDPTAATSFCGLTVLTSRDSLSLTTVLPLDLSAPRPPPARPGTESPLA